MFAATTGESLSSQAIARHLTRTCGTFWFCHYHPVRRPSTYCFRWGAGTAAETNDALPDQQSCRASGDELAGETVVSHLAAGRE
jgi:hypothetical protein